jgi:ABC-2 type transport system ATP-binding protein
MPAIEVHNLHKRYGNHVAVQDVSFIVERGEIFGIIGPNGAGKTTAVECIEGLRTPDNGAVMVLGLDPRSDRADLRQRVGAQLQESALPAKMKGLGGARPLRLLLSRAGELAAPAGRPGADGATERELRQALRWPETAAVHRPGAGW